MLPTALQELALEIALPSEWPVGLRYSLELVKAREERKDGAVVKSNEASTPLEVELLAKDDDGYVCRWTLGRTRITKGLDERNTAVAERIANVFEGLTIDMRLDTTGSVQGLADEDGARELIDRGVASVKQSLADGGMPAQTIDQVFGAALGAVDPKVLGASLLHEAEIFCLSCGGQFELGRRREYEDQLPNPFGGAPFPTGASIELTELRADAERATEVMRATMKTLARKQGKPEPAEGEVPKMAFEDRARFVFDVARGLPRAAEWTRTIRTDGQERVDSFRIDARFERAPSAAK